MRSLRFLRSLAALVSVPAFCAAAQAEGFYVEGGVFAHRYTLSVPEAVSTSGRSAKGHVVSPSLRLGYEFSDRWAVEAGYLNHGSPGYRYRIGSQDGELTSHGHSWVVAGRGTLPLGDRFAVVGKLGLANNHSSLGGTGEAASRAVSGSTTALYGSLGLETTIAPDWQVGLALEHLGKSREKGGDVINGISTTLRYKF